MPVNPQSEIEYVLALQEVILSIAGWFIVLFKRPYEPGDRIELGGVKGDVIDVRLFQTSVLEIGNWVKEDQSTGRITHIPNSQQNPNTILNQKKRQKKYLPTLSRCAGCCGVQPSV